MAGIQGIDSGSGLNADRAGFGETRPHSRKTWRAQRLQGWSASILEIRVATVATVSATHYCAPPIIVIGRRRKVSVIAMQHGSLSDAIHDALWAKRSFGPCRSQAELGNEQRPETARTTPW